MTYDQIASPFSLSDTIALVAIAAGFVVYAFQRQRRRLGYRIFSSERVTPFDFDQPGPREHEVAIQFLNDGNVPLIAADFLTPLTVRFSDSGTVSSSGAFQSAIDENLQLTVSHSAREGLVQLPLLNPGESVRARFRVREFQGQVRIAARIVGIRQVHNMAVREVAWLHSGLLASLYIGFVATRLRDHEAIDHASFWLVATPFVAYSLIRFVRVMRQQHLSWKVRPNV